MFKFQRVPVSWIVRICLKSVLNQIAFGGMKLDELEDT